MPLDPRRLPIASLTRAFGRTQLMSSDEVPHPKGAGSSRTEEGSSVSRVDVLAASASVTSMPEGRSNSQFLGPIAEVEAPALLCEARQRRCHGPAHA